MDKIGYKKAISILLCFIVPFFVCMIVSLLPSFNMEIANNGTNFSFHALRIKGLWWSLENGIFPHHINDMANDFMGDADPIGYPYLFLYIPAYLLRFLPYTYCYNIYVIIINVATFFMMYISSYYIFKDKKVSVVSSIAFTLFYYRLHDVYDFCRMGEYTGLMFYPLAISGLYNIFFDDKKKWWFLTIAMCGALGSHIITFFYLLLLVIALSIIFYIMSLIIKREPLRIFGFVKAGVISILLTLWWTIPFLEYFFEKSLNFSDMGTGGVSQTDIQFIMPWSFLSVSNGEPSYASVESTSGFFSIPTNMSFGDYISSMLLVLFIIAIIIFFIYKCIKLKDIKKVVHDYFDGNALYLILAILFFIIYIYYFRASNVKWHFQTDGPEIIKEMYAKQQFSFRELGRGGVFLSLSIGYIFIKVADICKSTISRYIAIYLVLIIMVLSTMTYIKSKLDGRYRQDDIQNSSLSDYQFKGNTVDDMSADIGSFDNVIELSGDTDTYDTSMYHIDNYRRGYLSVNFDYRYIATASTPKSEKLSLKKNAYTGYEYHIDGVKYDFDRMNDGRPVVTITGDKGHVNFRFINNIRWTIAFIASIVVFVICIIKRIYKEIKSIKDYIKDERGKNHE